MAKHALVNQPTAAPTLKVVASWLAGGGATAVLAGVAVFSDNLDGQTVLGAAVAAASAGIAAYFKRNKNTQV